MKKLIFLPRLFKNKKALKKKEKIVSKVKNKFSDFSLSKRQKFVLSVFILSIGLFFTEYLLGKSGFFVVLFLSALSALLFFLSVYKEIKEDKSLYVFMLPLFFFTLAVGLFYFLLPARLLSRIIITTIYAVLLYSLSLSQNIFIVATLRTIPLLSGARIVSLVVTLISYFLLSTVVFSLDLHPLFTSALLFIFSFFAVFQSIAVTLEKSFKKTLLWTLILALCLFEVSLILWMWPSTPTFIALFLTGLFYTIVGPSQVWLEKKLFRGVMWEYIWVGLGTFILLFVFTSWKG